MVYGDFKDLPKRTVFDKILPDKPFDNAKSPKYDGYQRRIASMIYKLFIKKTSGGVATLANKSRIKNEIVSNKELTKEKYTHLS